LESFFWARYGLDSSPRLSADEKLLVRARWSKDNPLGFGSSGIEVLAWPSGKVLAKRSGSYLPIGFRPGTTQVTMGEADRDHWVSLWDPSTDEEIGKYPGLMAAFSTDGSYLLTEDVEIKKKKALRLWNLADGREATPPAAGAFQGFLSEHEFLVLDEGRYRVWDCRAGQERFATPEALKAAGFSTGLRLAALSGRLGEEPPALHIWDLAADKRVGVVKGLSAFPEGVTFS